MTFYDPHYPPSPSHPFAPSTPAPGGTTWTSTSSRSTPMTATQTITLNELIDAIIRVIEAATTAELRLRDGLGKDVYQTVRPHTGSWNRVIDSVRKLMLEEQP